MAARLRVLCWDHPRCTNPMRAAARAYRQVRAGVDVILEARPLAAFNDQSIEQAVRGFDLVVFDHPMAARAATAGALLPLDDLMAGDPRINAVGASQRSYAWQGHSWGVAIDVACQVAAVRPDLLESLDADVPTTWDEVLAMAASHPRRVALPLYPSDAICSLMSMSVACARAAGEPDVWLRLEGVELLSRLARQVDAGCFSLNPPALLAELVASDRWAYVPLTFGYTDFSRPSRRPRVTWHDAPALAQGARGSVLGGAGLGVTAGTAAPSEALRFARWYADPGTQRDVVVPNGGQPASRAVWDDPAADQVVGGFFTGTRRTLDEAFTRPAAPWWPEFQEQAGLLLHRRLADRTPAGPIHSELVQLHAQYADAPAGVGMETSTDA